MSATEPDPLAAAERMLADYAWSADVDDLIASECGCAEAAVVSLRLDHEKRAREAQPAEHVLCWLAIASVRGSVADRRTRCAFDVEGHGFHLVEFYGTGETLILEVLRDLRARLRCVDGVAELTIGRRAMRVPSKACALEIAQLVYTRCDVVPDDRAVRRTMAVLAHRALAPWREPEPA